MSVKIRLTRVGKKKVPMYRIVVADERKSRDGRFIEILGQYQPLEDPSMVNFNEERTLEWLSKGAQATETVGKLLKITGIMDKHEATLSAPKAKKARVSPTSAKRAAAKKKLADKAPKAAASKRSDPKTQSAAKAAAKKEAEPKVEAEVTTDAVETTESAE